MPSRYAKWLLWGLVVVFNLAQFFVATLALHKAVCDLAIPYLVTFVMPVPIFVLICSWLRKWETYGPPPRLLAFFWGLLAAGIPTAVSGSILYFGLKLQLFDLKTAMDEFSLPVGFCVLTAFFLMYFKVLPQIIARADTFHLQS